MTRTNPLIEIRIDDLESPQVYALLQDHLRSVQRYSPPESIHALDLEALRKPEITFWTAWQDSELLGCAALKELNRHHGEIKSMKTSTQHLRRGVASSLLNHLLQEARRRGYQRLSLETGSHDAFEPARRLYASFGFSFCGPFSDYVEDRFSVFMTREI